MATFVISKMAGWFKQYLIEFSRADACMIIYMNLHIYKKNRILHYMYLQNYMYRVSKRRGLYIKKRGLS